MPQYLLKWRLQLNALSIIIIVAYEWGQCIIYLKNHSILGFDKYNSFIYNNQNRFSTGLESSWIKKQQDIDWGLLFVVISYSHSAIMPNDKNSNVFKSWKLRIPIVFARLEKGLGYHNTTPDILLLESFKKMSRSKVDINTIATMFEKSTRWQFLNIPIILIVFG